MKEPIGRVDNLLDHGYVIFWDAMGDDLTPINAAKVSYNKQSESFGKNEKRLTSFLTNSDPIHSAPFRHGLLQFECYAPLMVARQWWKYIIGSGHKDFEGGLQDPFTAWNESSRRYVTEEPEFYIPGMNDWRSQPDNKKQGSGKFNKTYEVGSVFTDALIEQNKRGVELYEAAMEAGIAAEQARLFLPAYGLYVRWWWTASLQGVAHFLTQRLEHSAQKEIQDFAKAVEQLAMMRFPIALKGLVDSGRA